MKAFHSILCIAGLASAVILAARPAAGQTAAARSEPRPLAALIEPHEPADSGPALSSCAACHTCDRPAADDPCLRPCPHAFTAPPPDAPGPTAPSAPSLAPSPAPPDVVMLDELADLYQPVPFDHRGHAEMAEMSSGCVVCHHHTPRGQEHPACRTCHESATAREDIAMPGLKGAYHRQCLNCHRQWSHDNACSACHVPAAAAGGLAAPQPPPAPADVLGRMTPPIALKATYVYATGHLPAPVVTFHHADHGSAYGVRCAECHQGDSCGRCHDNSMSPDAGMAHEGGSAVKSACLACHDGAHCADCHDRAERPPFDHAERAGWPLEPHHVGVPCGQCHGPVGEFTVPSPTCHACHVRPPRGGGLSHHLAAAGSAPAADANCLACHDDVKNRVEHAACVHGPASTSAGCAACHPTSQGLSPRPTRDSQRELCLGCHDRPIDGGRGRPLADIAALLAENPNHHGPVRDGHCSACHDPHASPHERLLVGEYTPGFYAAFDLSQYELCYSCHNDKQVLSESGTMLTGFRQGDLNLHWLHVNREKGRTCRACHEVHASDRPFHLRESVPFGNSGWMLPINYERTTDGGSCAPGCHAAKAYDRTPSVQASAGSIARPHDHRMTVPD